MKLFTLGILGTCSNNRGYSGAVLTPTALKTNYRSKIGSLLVLLIFLLGSFLIPSALYTQTLPNPKQCVSQDLLVVGATLVIGQCFTCEAGETVNLPLELSINNKTGSFRPTFAFFGTLEVTEADGTVTSSPISGCNDVEGLPPMEITEVTFLTIPYTCGTTLKLTNVFLAWTDASKPEDNKGNYDPTHPNSCPKLTTKLDSKGVLDITPKCGTDDEIIINTPINVTIDEPIVICEGQSVTLTANATGGDGAYSYLWSTGETTPSIEVSPVETTDYTVTVSAPSIFDPNVRCSDSFTATVTVNPANDAGDDGELTVCSSDLTDYNLRDYISGEQNSGTWTGPGGASDGNFMAGTDAAGTYTYTVDSDGVDGPCPADSAEVVVTVNPANDAGDDGDLTVCAGDTTSYNLFLELGGTPQTGGTWSVLGGGSFDGTFNASTDAAGTFIYTVDKDGVGPCEEDSAEVVVTITPANNAGDDGELTVCSDDVTGYSLFDELGGTPQTGGTWTAPNGSDFGDGTFNASSDASGVYTYTVDADGEGPCAADSADVVVTINPLPPLTIQIAPNDCFSDPINPGKFVVTSTTTGLKFSLDGGTFVVYTGEYTGLAPGSHSIKAKDDITGCESLLLFNIDQPFSSPVSPILSAVQPDCATLKGTISVTNVVAGQTYAIKLKSDLSDPVYASYPTNGFENLDPGVYVVLVKSADGCSGSGAEITLIEPNCVTGEGCTLGYWKNHTTKWCSTYTTCTLYSSVFTPSAEFSLIYPNLTLLQALNLMRNTDGENLARQSVAALLNACSSSVGYDLTEAQVIAQTNAAWLSGGSNINTVATALDVLNNQLCTLGGPRSTKPTPICVAAKGKPVSKVANTVAKGSGNVTLDSNSNAKQFRASPVPFRETLSIEYDFDYSSAAKIQLFDLQGRLLRTYNEANAFKGKVTELSIDFRTRASQVYVIKITTDRDVFTKKIISDK